MYSLNLNWMNLLFLMLLITSSMLALTSWNWFFLWCMLEINMMAFMPLMFKNNNMSSNCMFKYFLIQSLASSLLFFMMISLKNFNFDFFMTFSSMPLLMKLGYGIFYSWYPQITEGLTWINIFILSTIQKIIPFYIISFSFTKIYFYMIFISLIISMISLMKLTSLRKIMAFSSISHLSWLMMSFLSNHSNWMLYFYIYMFMNMNIMFYFNKNNLSSTFQLYYMKSITIKIMILISLLNLMGLPPMMGFYSKLMIFMNIHPYMNMNMFLLILNSLISSYIYIRMIFPSIMNNLKINKSMNNMNLENKMLIFNILFMILLIPFGKI